jgi:excisionase family DNA binding protein
MRLSRPAITVETRAEIGVQTCRVDETLSTTEIAWLLGTSPTAVRSMIKSGEIESARIVSGFRIPKAEAIRLGRERIEREAGRSLSDREVERLIDEVLATNRSASPPGA